MIPKSPSIQTVHLPSKFFPEYSLEIEKAFVKGSLTNFGMVNEVGEILEGYIEETGDGREDYYIEDYRFIEGKSYGIYLKGKLKDNSIGIIHFHPKFMEDMYDRFGSLFPSVIDVETCRKEGLIIGVSVYHHMEGEIYNIFYSPDRPDPLGIILEDYKKSGWDVPESVILMKRVKSESIDDCEICTKKSIYAGQSWVWDRELQKEA